MAKKILIVDDSPPIRSYMSDCLNILGFNDLQQAENGLVALDICSEELPDIITLDWNMPEMDGLEFLKALRGLPNGAKPVVVFCSTESSARKIALVLESGANEYITKPFDQHVLRDVFTQLGLIQAL